MGKIKVNEIEKHDASEITINDTVKVDTIAEKTSGSGVTVDGLTIKDTGFDEPVKMKGYTTTQMNSLSGMGAGDTIYNSTVGTLYVYNGVTWSAMSDNTFTVAVEYLVIAGGGAGGGSGTGGNGGGGGAGGYLASYGSDSSGGGGSNLDAQTLNVDTNYTVTIGAGGVGTAWNGAATNGSNSVFNTATATGGGRGGDYNTDAAIGGSGGGGTSGGGGGSRLGAAGTANQGFAGGDAAANNNTYPGAGGGGAGGVGANGTAGTNHDGGDGGAGLADTITGSAVSRGGGGGGGSDGVSSAGGDATHGGGDGGGTSTNGTAGTANTGGGGGAGGHSASGGNGGSGVVVLRYPAAFNITVGSGLTSSDANTTVGSDKYTTITAGNGNISFAIA